MNDFDYIVVGAGIEGSSAAWHLARNGNRTLLLEQFPLPHSRGSSHGQTRIIRKSYVQNYYGPMMEYAYNEFMELQKNSGDDVFEQTGILTFGDGKSSIVKDVTSSLERRETYHEIILANQLRQRFPMLHGVVGNAVYEPSGGFLRADKVLALIQKVFVANGGVLHDAEPVHAVQVENDGRTGKLAEVKVVTSRRPGGYKCRKVVLCLGAWAASFVDLHLGIKLPLEISRINVCYWKETDPQMAFPSTFIAEYTTDQNTTNAVYGIRSEEYPGLFKVCAHGGARIQDPGQRDKESPAYDDDIELVRYFLARHFPSVDCSRPAVVERCMYTSTPDRQPILDKHPRFANVVIAAGFSGHGFKLGPVVGRLLCDLAMERKPLFDLDPFRLDRFHLRSKY